MRWLWWLLGALALLVMLGTACGMGVAVGAGLVGGGSVGPAVGIVPITGAIQGGEGGGISEDGAYADYITRTLRRIQRDSNIKAVVLRIDSPGGGVTPSDEIHNEVVRTRTQFNKPVFVSVGGMAASGGYYIAVGADRITANPTSITGSIGVITVLPNLQGLMEKVGVQADVLTTGPYKDIGSGLRPLTAGDRAIMQGVLDDAYARFVKVVADGRKMDEAKVRQLADGRIYTATQAKDLGLLDDFGDLPDVIAAAGRQVGLGERPRTVNYGRRGFFSSLGAGASSFWPGAAMNLPTPFTRSSLGLVNYLYVVP
ncbi:MAG: signal peptide peptidase SppA [Chloroflexi bacterium]|nr:signal peptide peptidase SppA [Chloroflexota bacterium]